MRGDQTGHTMHGTHPGPLQARSGKSSYSAAPRVAVPPPCRTCRSEKGKRFTGCIVYTNVCLNVKFLFKGKEDTRSGLVAGGGVHPLCRLVAGRSHPLCKHSILLVAMPFSGINKCLPLHIGCI